MKRRYWVSFTPTLTIVDNLRAFIAGFDDARRDQPVSVRRPRRAARQGGAPLPGGRTLLRHRLAPDKVINTQMGYVYEELIQRFSEKPGKGRYCCTNCGWSVVVLDDDDDRLPPCGNCGKGQETTYQDC